MTEPLEDRLEDWMRGVGRFDATDVHDFVQRLPIPNRRARSIFGGSLIARLGVAVVVVIAIGAGVGLLSTGNGPGGGPMPPDPRAFAGDPRLAQCGLTDTSQAEYVFELAHAADFQTAFPAALRTPELERADPAFVIVVAPGVVPLGIGGGSGSSPRDEEGSRVCVIVGAGPDAVVNLYSGVDLAGFSPDAVGRLAPVSGAPPHSTTPVPSQVEAATTTPIPGIDWGPLAVVPPSDGADTARTEGIVRISAECVVLETGATRSLLVWPADRTVWHTAESNVSFENFDGKIVTVGDGDNVIVGGSGGSFGKAGKSLEAWLDATGLVARPPGPCDVDEYWYVGGVQKP